MGTWGRHGWPRKDEGMRLYKGRDGTYLMVDAEPNGTYYDAVSNVLIGNDPSLGSTQISLNYTYNERCTRVQWSELPKEWQDAFRRWFDDDPASIRGFWLVGQQP